MEEKREYIIVCALDIGSWGSGYGFLSTRENDPKVTVETNWGGPNVGSCKTATDVLFESGEFLAFGHESLTEFLEAKNDQSRGLELYQKFKMVLCDYEGHGSKVNLQVKDASGTKERTAQELFMHTMSFLKDRAIDRIRESYPRVKDKEIRWVVTVPAIWTPQAKLIMKSAAFDAKLWTDEDPDQLVLCHEPEAALHECKVSNPRDVVVNAGDQYLVVDVGGGTADFAAHEVAVNGIHVKEVLSPSGGAWGSNYVNAEFGRILGEIFGSELIDQIREENPSLMVSLMEKFEVEKTKRRMPTSKELFWIEVNPKFQQIIEEKSQRTVAEIVEMKPEYGISFDQQSRSLVISEKGIEIIFQAVIIQISSWTSRLLSNPKMNLVKYIFLVGGFANSKRLGDALKRNEHVLAKKIPVIIPKLPELCVLKGACRYGINPRTAIVEKRISPMSYGLKIDREFQHGDPEKCKRIIDGEVVCSDVFDLILTKGTELTADSCWKETYRTLADNVSLELYAHSRDTEVSFVFEEGVHCVGVIRKSFPPKYKGALKEIDVKIVFGGTNLEVTFQSSVGDKQTHKIQLTEI
eukprot:TRINITY_DN23704_c0_g1_i1.p1 TRINITY_DN23704_c0_g1~~TRINITY_DN23704_c0_g1_i1.p1  ORF type:complete len:579 (-),score=141.62 TRINITY_DN23704_c0_g1_i1:1932-3668(-)